MNSKALNSEHAKKILKQRAELLAQHTAEVIVKKQDTILVFHVGLEKYAIVYQQLEKAIPAQPITPIPYAPELFLGVFYYNGDIWPVVSASLLMQVDADQAFSHIILLRQEQNLIALATNEITEQKNYDAKKSLTSLSQNDNNKKPFIQGVYQTDIALINIKKLFDYVGNVQLTKLSGEDNANANATA